jgi:hypothetical protein
MNHTIHPARARTCSRALTTSLVTAGLGLSLVACGGGDGNKTSGTTAAAAATGTTATTAATAATAATSGAGGSTKKGCDVVTAADFKTVFGVDPKESTEGPGGGLATCSHTAVITEPSVKVLLAMVRFSPNGAGSFDGEQGGVERALKAKGVAVSGIGDKAIETVGTVSGQTQAWITTTKGKAVVQVSVAGVDTDTESKSKVEALAKLAVGHL